MKHSKTEVRHWRMLRQQQRQKTRWMSRQSRRNKQQYLLRKFLVNHQRSVLLFASYR